MKKAKAIFSLVVALMVLAIFCFAQNTGSTATTAAAAVDSNNDDWLHCKGNKIYDMYGNEVWLTGANWFGFNCSENCFHGAWYDVKTILTSIADRGINLLRIPISTELLYSWMIGKPNPVSSVTASNNPPYHVVNPDFYDPETDDVKNSMEIFDIIMGYCKELGIKVMIDIHSPDANNSGHNYELWYGKETSTCGVVTTKMWIDTLVWLADKYKNDDTIIAFDLKNEPHGKRGYTAEVPKLLAKWDNSTDENNWKYAAETCAKAILEVNPKVLIVIEGVEQYPKTEKGYTYDTPDIWGATGDASPWYSAWWGGNLRGVKDYPIDLGPLNSQIVYSPHDYGPSVYAQPWFEKDFTMQTLLDDYWYDTWAYIHDQGIAPILIGEWGGHMDGGKNQKWMTLLRDYIVQNRIHHTFWCINPNSGDTGGLLGNDWSTWDEAKYALLKPALWQTKDGKFIGLDHKIPLGSKGISLGEYYGTPQASDPPATPTATPTKPAASSTPSFIYGDINSDGNVNSTDLGILKRIIVKNPPASANMDAADVNADGKVNSTDYTVLKRYLLRSIDKLPHTT
ncbi:MAG TPA: endoglucanase [Hungateiclostridium thermocellum]|uniref:Endoglucanase G n=1 Tax=Acetivibrio thermocellus (strain ATCC 27405 / DSM 1237 / JCM 9322 / NBRC 103400 / NCIMB 10682 / NRRL B-4536 / VPI 7372) TaxID=203119 RepID=GUNG_ACET2|nr:cellulase family glycosylhydrolase [Acetivibrio thermocellus]Q05332.1 RecName: Full=Endoglucanase G; AltName: Full=Cellulase G; AltName: Full=Endo-1,4-beta-glucanase G; Short=EgG; Flags: Precursor [Acetivibrio thermocellus ATCC 27405]CDG37363.1 Endoglucanase G [Acetivibrio thermocellus BC1]ABN54070.1 glycoside hydrolase family 5 [Acetivibrio thermocellus ATCC 27405]NLU27655.1 cellulase family glycosylhydrolase [Acetivibrio thermocellus]THJ77934.1 endoglucanase [Acetivibrio thermocellus]CAA